MPNMVEPKAFLIAETKLVQEGLKNSLEELGVPNWSTDAFSDAEHLIEFSGKSCFDKETEILTSEGWKYFKDLTKNEFVLTLNPNSNNLEYQKPKAYQSYHYSGNMISFENRDLSFCVTPNHRLWVKELGKEDWLFKEADNCFNSKYEILRRAQPWKEGKFPSEVNLESCEFLQVKANKYGTYGSRIQTTAQHRSIINEKEIEAIALLSVFYATEGTISETHTNKKIIIYGTPHVFEVSSLCKTLGISINTYTDKRNGVIRTYINSRQLADYFEKECGLHSKDKHLPTWVLNLPLPQLQKVWDILVKTDGHVYKDGQEVICTISNSFINQIYELIVKLGYSPSKNKSNGTNYPCYNIRKKKLKSTIINSKNNVIKNNNYNDIVYCVTTQNGVVCVRRNNKVHFSGNCYMSFDTELNKNLTRVGTKNNYDYIQDQIIKTGHGSVLEHGCLTFFLVNVSRVLTHEVVRHRAGMAFSQVSGRYVRTDKINYWLPSVIKNDPWAATFFHNCFAVMEMWIKQLEEHYKIDELKGGAGFKLKKILTSAFRRIIGNGQANHIVVTCNHRSLRHVVELRTYASAEEEIRLIFNQVFNLVKDRYPGLYADAKIVFDEPDNANSLFSVKFNGRKV